ncbi:MAG: GNAT family N-acetyltransferase, partial [Cyanobacteria bacterium J06639_18]
MLNTSFHDRESFDCGKSQLNNYLKNKAGQDAKKQYSRTFVATTGVGSKNILGYYCTSASSIGFENIPENLSKRLPKYPAPVMLIGRLAVDKQVQGQRLGETLLMHALNKAIRVNLEMAIFAIRVDALDEQAKKFYLH